jgi:hypothetical protein
MITVVRFLVVCVAALVEKIFFMDLSRANQPLPESLLYPERYRAVAQGKVALLEPRSKG